MRTDCRTRHKNGSFKEFEDVREAGAKLVNAPAFATNVGVHAR
jgi:hypothetical protein